MFDIAAKGVKKHTAWTLPGTTIAFLALDRNGNGQIDSGAELFGNSTVMTNGTKAANGFEALADLVAATSSADGELNALDSVYYELRLWIDKNHNGVSEPDELIGLDEAGITAIELAYKPVRRQDPNGNLLKYQGEVFIRTKNGVHPHKMYDVYLGTRP